MRDPREATGLLPPDVLASLAREHLRDVLDVHVAPDIPPRKLRGARAAYEASLRPDEPIVVLLDATFLGSGGNGFVATPARLCWKNHFDHARSARWDDLAQAALAVRGANVELGRGLLTAPVTERMAEQVRAFLSACCRRTTASSAPYRDFARTRGPSTFAELVVSAARRALGELEWVHYAPSIPPKMLRAARVVHERHLGPRDEILVLYDDTVFGAGNDGVVLTGAGVLWRNFWGSAEMIAWTEVDPERVVTDGDQLFFEGDPTGEDQRRIDLRMRPGMAHLVAAALREIARAAGAGRETGPPR